MTDTTLSEKPNSEEILVNALSSKNEASFMEAIQDLSSEELDALDESIEKKVKADEQVLHGLIEELYGKTELGKIKSSLKRKIFGKGDSFKAKEQQIEELNEEIMLLYRLQSHVNHIQRKRSDEEIIQLQQQIGEDQNKLAELGKRHEA